MNNHHSKSSSYSYNLMNEKFLGINSSLNRLTISSNDQPKQTNEIISTINIFNSEKTLLPIISEDDIKSQDNSLNNILMDAQFSPNHLRMEAQKYYNFAETTMNKMDLIQLKNRRYSLFDQGTAFLTKKAQSVQVNSDKRITSWSKCFDNLLKDTIGVKIFTKFLSKEFCDENIHFWLSCEKYKKLTKFSELKKEAKSLYERFLSVNAVQPINVDSKAQITIMKSLSAPTKDIFNSAQTQVYNLMKNDCYKRFLSSDLYQKCLESEKTGNPLPYCSKEDSEPFIMQPKNKRRISLTNWTLKNPLKF